MTDPPPVPTREYAVRLQDIPQRVILVRLTERYLCDDLTVVAETIAVYAKAVYPTGWRPTWLEIRDDRRDAA